MKSIMQLRAQNVAGARAPAAAQTFRVASLARTAPVRRVSPACRSYDQLARCLRRTEVAPAAVNSKVMYAENCFLTSTRVRRLLWHVLPRLRQAPS